MSKLIPGNMPLLFPEGTTVAHNSSTWAMYVNPKLNVTWIGYAVPRGTMITQLPGVRSRLGRDFDGIKKFVKQKQATACGACGD